MNPQVAECCAANLPANFQANSGAQSAQNTANVLPAKPPKLPKLPKAAPAPLSVVLEWAGSGEPIGTWLIDFDSFPLPQATTKLTSRASHVQSQVLQAIAHFFPGTQPAQASRIKVFDGHSGVELTPDPTTNKRHFAASKEAKKQWQALLKRQRDQHKLGLQKATPTSGASNSQQAKTAKTAKQVKEKEEEQKVLLSVGLYTDYRMLLRLIKETKDYYKSNAFFESFSSARKGVPSTWNDIVLDYATTCDPAVLAAVCNAWPRRYAEFIPTHLCNDINFMKQFKDRGLLLKASQNLLANKKFLRHALSIKQSRSCKSMLKHLSSTLRNDKKVVCAAVWSGGPEELQYASDAIRDDLDVVRFACSLNALSLKHASPRLKTNVQLVNACLLAVPATYLTEFRQTLDPTWKKEQRAWLESHKLSVVSC